MDEGWPPATFMGIPLEPVWQNRLRGQSLNYWRVVTWHAVTRHIRLEDLHPVHRQAVVDTVRAAIDGERNAITSKVVDLVPRFSRIMSYLATHRRLPRAPVFWLARDGLTILDGHHRMAAYFYARGEISTRVSAHLPTPPDALQQYWIGTTSRMGSDVA